MPELVEVWSVALPTIRNGLTGVGVWTALNLAKPIALEEGTLVLGLPHTEMELAGHLRMPATKRLIEVTVGGLLKSPVTARVINGTEYADWEVEKRRDTEKRRLTERSLEKQKAELSARSNWEHIFEQLSRRFAAVSNKSLPQNKARFFEEVVAMLAEARQTQTEWDDLAERNFARCLERVSQYTDVPSTLVASMVLQKSGEL
jgi:hypothetical protein